MTISPPDGPDTLITAVAAVAAVAERSAAQEAADVDTAAVLEALELLRWVQERLAATEPRLIEAARRAGVSWQALAPALGVASRQAAERRYLRSVPAAGAGGGTREDRVRAERDHRAGVRAVAQWAADNTADLRRLAGQVAGLRDAPAAATADLDRLHRALADPDAAALPALLAAARRHLGRHPGLAEQVDEVTASTDAVLRHTQRRRDEQALAARAGEQR
ncbi:hypothetical protein Daura_24920 [Dactylosporangium aurantiacum]|uniref:HSP18 transcriptional regulator n=1 Tax=Dactylosporangium aurantiacum TaxID=35754 RepID=A0A9Q9IMX9_9ACTN|nr:hypothetical protein [Dactylosporangium aurantiacum]MDG6108671.1 hypothetical protein [Dactylosporangium aurantiacum]UWZ59117.1 hypothetical protein Daura_24920 [Dactylosporangium aurantiacum]